MAQPTPRYAKAGDVNIAYEVIGDGPVDLVWAWGLASNIEVAWEEPSYAAFLRRLSESARVIVFDRRGCGLSDREGTTVTPTLEERMDDVIAVLDAVGSDAASIFGVSEGGVLAAALAATHPNRVNSIILYGTVAHFRRDAAHPWGLAEQGTLADFVEWMRQGWGTVRGAENAVRLWAPSMIGDVRFTAWLAKHSRHAVSRGAILPLMWSSVYAYLVDVFPAIRVPTLVLHRRDDRLVPVDQGRRIAEHIPEARFIELPGEDHFPFVGESEIILTEVEAFLLGRRNPWSGHRRLLTALCIEVAGNAETLNLTPIAWRQLIEEQAEMISDHVNRYNGEAIRRTHQGVFAAFDGPSRAIRCAISIADAAGARGLRMRAGLHTGECDVSESDVQGAAVDTATLIAQVARPGQILVSGTVCDLVPGSGFRFGDGQSMDFAGTAGPRIVFPVLKQGAAPELVRHLAIDQANILRLDGDYWTAAYGGLVVTMRDSKGLRDLARLLATPNREFHVLELIAPPPTRGHRTAPSRDEAQLRLDAPTKEPVIDEAARAAYKHRIAELRQDLHDAEEAYDAEGGAKARHELDQLIDHLASAYGLGNRIRHTPDHVERARKAVTRRIRDAVKRAERAHPSLGRHLRASVRTGVFCSYSPEHGIEWSIKP
jgi:pimeloyl-ACP methyl ester carboxylesterase/class 3 adenylate cyclase